ncbi:hypothetical protein REC12_26135 [Desulfosporosinus sp. PR]|uniref:hypothetical protein n=1 Tax=Candidatus Desulfosporosinus nitrosoreducens TaxID=3401928 RepID=UPI0027EE5D2A|nr:hypothetical protein [Desulfosporosinus sp. PR]MDQ7097080.1 hypothetical protein [Desulfosporosinus sp. PR]
MIASIGSNHMLSKMTLVNQNVMAKKGTSEEAKESMSEKIAETQSLSAKATKIKNPTYLGNKIDRLA